MFWRKWFRTKPNLPPLVPGQRDYWLTIRVRLTPPFCPEDAGGREMVGYYPVLGLRCLEDEYRSVLDQWVSDGGIVWGETECSEIDVTRLDGRDVHPLSPEGLFIESPKMYFPREPEADGLTTS